MNIILPKKKIIAAVLIFILTSTMFLSYDNQSIGSSNHEQINAAIVTLYHENLIFVYNEYGKPVSGLTVVFSNGYTNVTNSDGYAGCTFYTGVGNNPGGPRIGPLDCVFYNTIYGEHNFNNVCIVPSSNFYFSGLVESPNNSLDPAIMLHSFTNIQTTKSNLVSCAYLCCYRSNGTIQGNNAMDSKVLGKYTNFTTIVIPISRYMTAKDNYDFTISAVGLVKSYQISSTEVNNITSSQSRPYTMIWEVLFQIVFITSIIALTGLFFSPPLTDNPKYKQNKVIKNLKELGQGFLTSYIPVVIALILSTALISFYSLFTSGFVNIIYIFSLFLATLFLTVFMTLCYSLTLSYRKKEIRKKFVIKWAIVIEFLWVGIFTAIEIGFIGSSDVFNPTTHLINTVLVTLQYLNPLEYAILIIDVMNSIILMPAGLPGSLINYNLNSIFITIAVFIVLLFLIITYMKLSEKELIGK